MLKKITFVTGLAIAIAAAASLPASAAGGGRNFSDPEEVPEPLTIVGSLLVGGGLLTKKLTSKGE
ncbi:MAG: PEP-CTERM sorting domain-containing protein [Elainellaceae cyanobacterium]